MTLFDCDVSCCTTSAISMDYCQGSHASSKSGKITEFKKGIFHAWKVMENDCGHGKVMEFHQWVVEFFLLP